jgi:tetratricopeptide (TPR) repeat protein
LEPLNKEPKPAGQIIQGSSKSYELNAKNPAKPFNPKALREFEKGKQKQKDGKLDDAARHYQKAIEFDPSFYPALNNLGVIYIRQKQFAKANEAFLQAMKLNPDDSQAYINMGHLHYQQGQYPEAIAELERGLERFPGSALGRFLLGSAYLKVGGLEKAEANLRRACALDPKSMSQAHLQLANLYLMRGEPSLASTELESYLRVNRSDPQAPAIKKLLAKLKPN